MENFIAPLVGGITIGVAASVMLYFNGQITGISGIIGRSLERVSKANHWRYAFILGLLVGGFIMKMAFPSFFNYSINSSPVEIIIAGLLVGFGTLLGNGCTSGHGVCGLPRFSKRSMVATGTFMGFGILTVLIRGLL